MSKPVIHQHAMLLSDNNYLLRTGVPFIVPVHPMLPPLPLLPSGSQLPKSPEQSRCTTNPLLTFASSPIKPAERTTWSPYGADGWYTSPALELYRCYTVWLWITRATRVCNTLSWIPSNVTMPLALLTDFILAGIHDIVQALQNPSPGSSLAP